ncbi:MAG TPA: hypothetical protein PKA64_18225, partial [Myxococcota bacterium]|nr:hypothetical protein [Myxococcota bacterium]
DSARTDLAPPVAAEPELRTTPPPDVDAGRAQEVGAILADPEFIDRRGLLTLLRELFGDDVVGESDARRGRQELVARGVRRFAGLPADQKTRIYTTLRRRFLRDRRSTLEGWSNTIRGGK